MIALDFVFVYRISSSNILRKCYSRGREKKTLDLSLCIFPLHRSTEGGGKGRSTAKDHKIQELYISIYLIYT